MMKMKLKAKKKIELDLNFKLYELSFVFHIQDDFFMCF